MKTINVVDNIGVPKYKQIISSIESAILSGEYKRGDKLPSINSVKLRFSLSRDTVLLAYNDLKVRGIVNSVPGKGYYVKSESIEIAQKIFLLFDELNAFKEDLYNSFLKSLNNNVEVDIYFHHFNYDVFSKLIYDNIGNYNYYVIMPANLNDIPSVLDILPQDKVYILDQTRPELAQYPAIHQNFKKDILTGLVKGLHLLKKYQKLVLLFQEKKQPSGMFEGFEMFCNTYHFNSEVIDSLEERTLTKGEVYIIPDDRSLIRIIKKIKEVEFTLAKDIGIISYNDTLLKEIVEGGITTISTDFNKMGERLAEMIMNKEQIRIENINNLILRNSL
ncbi:DNA-binding transcriptional regulator YhcF (GntR family) [Aquimarina sp. EL_43]|uniref:GntR family transcriptional regulator n=1 Tax=Aquimarina TaxID=290174 RepID=UPI0004703392|nr:MULTISPECIES: GntR family transcriptional regulator [Aquimarina]MBG6133713.1 DNA-binding transcriptional regulator YhcF (GntR family) [Aquimarina sp. EL_35]MBG6153886.1 DNA-binding transcriptional regulator YhcF (GntR family) [Aquimarina sp. EL_32]MBG6172086.1 DNA-binding transcriptional regulator YhcF (GntR family) [Aquimarina sp. EL_43]